MTHYPESYPDEPNDLGRLYSAEVAKALPRGEAMMDVPWLQSDHYENIFGALVMVVILSLILERALAVVFEWSGWRDWLSERKLRTPLAFLAAYVTCMTMEFDVLAVMFAKPNGYSSDFSFGTFATAAVVAGGSKGAILLFQGVLGFGRDAVKARVEAKSRPLIQNGRTDSEE